MIINARKTSSDFIASGTFLRLVPKWSKWMAKTVKISDIFLHEFNWRNIHVWDRRTLNTSIPATHHQRVKEERNRKDVKKLAQFQFFQSLGARCELNYEWYLRKCASSPDEKVLSYCLHKVMEYLLSPSLPLWPTLSRQNRAEISGEWVWMAWHCLWRNKFSFTPRYHTWEHEICLDKCGKIGNYFKSTIPYFPLISRRN